MAGSIVSALSHVFNRSHACPGSLLESQEDLVGTMRMIRNNRLWQNSHMVAPQTIPMVQRRNLYHRSAPGLAHVGSLHVRAACSLYPTGSRLLHGLSLPRQQQHKKVH